MDTLITQQIAKLQQLSTRAGFSWEQFQLTQKDGIDTIVFLTDPSYYFQFLNHSLQGLKYRDVYFYYYDAENIERRHWYFGCNSFLDAIAHFDYWIDTLTKL